MTREKLVLAREQLKRWAYCGEDDNLARNTIHELLNISINAIDAKPPEAPSGLVRSLCRRETTGDASNTDRRRFAIIDAIYREREHQDRKWGSIDQHPHEVGAWIALLESLAQKARDGWTRSKGDDAALAEILQVLAVGFACLEQHGVVERQSNLPGQSDSGLRSSPTSGNIPFTCPKCNVSHSRGPTQPCGDVYRCLKCGLSYQRVGDGQFIDVVAFLRP